MTDLRPQTSDLRRGFSCLMSLVSCLIFTGCVERTIVIESDPPGATVWINEHRLELPTPVAYEFITHGRYKFRLEKSGFRELVAREMVWAPIYEWIPIDFFTENLLPLHLRDRHVFQYHLDPRPPSERLQVETQEDFKAVMADLTSPSVEKRRLACVTLARLRDPATGPAVLAATSDSAASVRAAALGAWRGIQGPQAIDRLEEVLRLDPNREVRWQAAAELEALGDPQAVPILIEALKDRDPLVRGGAAEALKGIPDPRAVWPLIRALRDQDTTVRRAATEGLGRIGDQAAVPALTKVLFHHDVVTRRKAVEALAQLKDPSSGPALVRTFNDWDPEVRHKATDALINFGDERVVPPLIRQLRAWNPWTREHAARALGGLKDPRAVKPLQTALAREPDPPAYQAMLEALKALGAQPQESWYRIFPVKEKTAVPSAPQENRMRW